MEDERDAEDAIRRLDRIEFGRKGRRIRVEWTKVLQLINWDCSRAMLGHYSYVLFTLIILINLVCFRGTKKVQSMISQYTMLIMVLTPPREQLNKGLLFDLRC